MRNDHINNEPTDETAISSDPAQASRLRSYRAHPSHAHANATAAASTTGANRTQTSVNTTQRRASGWRLFAVSALAVGTATVGATGCAPAPAASSATFADRIVGELDAFPVVGPTTYSDDYGAARSGGRSHQGNDIMADRGQHVLAVEAGTLVSVGWSDLSGYKIWLVTDSGAAYFYAHLDQFAQGIETGARVWSGQWIGTVGNTGNASGGAPHLHFEIHPGGRSAASVNPYNQLRTAEARGPVVEVPNPAALS